MIHLPLPHFPPLFIEEKLGTEIGHKCSSMYQFILQFIYATSLELMLTVISLITQIV